MLHRLLFEGPFDLDLTLSCGQAFRWRREDARWSGVVGGAELRVGLGPGELLVEVAGRDPGAEALRRYFRLDENPEVHLEHVGELRALPGLLPLLGLRLLRQDPWETLASFVCSAAANIRKISGCVEAMASRWGSRIRGSTRRTFPDPAAVAEARERELRRLGLGFRSPYVRGAARIIATGSLHPWDGLRRMALEEARRELCELPGIGPKIADCVLLFGLDRLEAYPVDRWIRRATLELSSKRRARDEELVAWAARLGPARGYVQQLLFHLRRTSGPFPPLAVR